MDYTISFVYRQWRGGNHVVNLRINPDMTLPLHSDTLELVERGTLEWDA